jgi:L-2-hydroxyglutarate oxidase LhgO
MPLLPHRSTTTTLSWSSAAFSTQVCVIGAGVVGLAVARALAQQGRDVLLVDQASTIGSETSSRNSEVIHAGLYYPSHSLKAQLCVRGKHQLYRYCRERNIPFHQCGKLIVATQHGQVDKELKELCRQAHRNGVTDVTLVSPEEVREMEPQVHCVGGALWSPSTGVLDSHSFMTSLLTDAQDAGTTLVLNTKVTAAAAHVEFSDKKRHGGSRLLLQFADETCIACDTVINAAGLWAPRIARCFHPPPSSGSSSGWQPPRGYYAKGTYFVLQGVTPLPFSHLIYPVPEPGGLGVHATIDWVGQSVRFGPDVEWVVDEEDHPPNSPWRSTEQDPSTISLRPDPQRGIHFYDHVRQYWPDLPDDSLVPDYVGIRPKLNHPSKGPLEFQDFLIAGPALHGIQGLVHLLGIESPGLTSSMAIADYVATSQVPPLLP